MEPGGSITGTTARSCEAALTTAELAGWLEALTRLDTTVDDVGRIDQLRALERVKAACSAAQARVTTAFAASQRAAQRAAGVKPKDIGKGIGAQVALARMDSRFKGGRHLGPAEALVHELPHTLAALSRGATSEWRATLVARETACLSPDDRRRADAELADRLPEHGDKQAAAQARKLAYRLDPQAFMSRVRGAADDRRVTIRPAPDTMALVTGFLPVAQGVAVHAALTRTASTMKVQGDPRSRAQIMADEFVTRLTGQARPEDVPVEVQLVMTDRTLLGDDAEPAQLAGHGPIPAWLARRLVANPRTKAWLRRLFTRPDDHSLLTIDSRQRAFPDGMRQFIGTRDQVCRTPWCDAPIRHTDHVEAVEDGGATTLSNGQGLCEACNYSKQAPGWRSYVRDHDTIEVITPIGHHYSSHPPPLPGAGLTPRVAVPEVPGRAPPAGREASAAPTSPLEERFRALLDAA